MKTNIFKTIFSPKIFLLTFSVVFAILFAGCGQLPIDFAFIVIGPTPAKVGPNQTWQFYAQADDQYGSLTGITPSWSVIGGIGTINADGLFTAGPNTGEGRVVASYGGKTASVEVEVIDWGWLAGTITDASNFHAVGGVKVYLKENLNLSAISDHWGKYTISNIPPGTYEVWTEVTGTYEAVSKEVTTLVGKYIFWDIKLKPLP